MRRGVGAAASTAVGFVALLSVLAGSASGAGDTPTSGKYDVEYTLVSFSPAVSPGAPVPPRPPSPQHSSLTLRCGATCSAIMNYGGPVSLTRVSAGHYRVHKPFNFGGGCIIDAPNVDTDVDLQFSGAAVTGRVVVKHFTVTDPCGQHNATYENSGFTLTIRGTLEGGSPASVPQSVPASVPGRTAGGRASAHPADADRFAKLSSRQRASFAAEAAGRVSAVPASLQSPSEAFGDAGHVGQNLLLAAVLVLLLVFPAELFNSTFDKHHERIESAWRRRFRRKPKAERSSTPSRRAIGYLVVVLVGSLLAGFLDPHFGLKAASMGLLVGVILSTLFAAALGGLANREFRRVRRHPTQASLVAVPAGLAIAFMCVVVSRAVHFQPGYLYGLVGGYTFVAALDDREEGRARFTGFVVALVVATLGWLLFVPVSHSANHLHPNFVVLVADAFLAAIFIGGIEGALFSLVPLQFLPGHHIVRWSRIGWAVLAFATAFLFVDVLLRPQAGYLGRSSTASAVVTYGLFALFGAASLAFWAWFRTHPDATAVNVAALGEPGGRPMTGGG